MTILCAASASLPEARAGCGNPARPDPWRGLWATMIPTPTLTGKGRHPSDGKVALSAWFKLLYQALANYEAISWFISLGFGRRNSALID